MFPKFYNKNTNKWFLFIFYFFNNNKLGVDTKFNIYLKYNNKIKILKI